MELMAKLVVTDQLGHMGRRDPRDHLVPMARKVVKETRDKKEAKAEMAQKDHRDHKALWVMQENKVKREIWG